MRAAAIGCFAWHLFVAFGLSGQVVLFAPSDPHNLHAPPY